MAKVWKEVADLLKKRIQLEIMTTTENTWAKRIIRSTEESNTLVILRYGVLPLEIGNIKTMGETTDPHEMSPTKAAVFPFIKMRFPSRSVYI